MSASEKTNGDQFGQVLNEAAGLPPEFGSQPIPPGAVRVQHLTWSKNVESIRKEGLLQSKTSPHSEAQQVFATTGDKLEYPMSGESDRAVVEGYAFPHGTGPDQPYSQLDVGSGMSPERAASRHSTVTFHGDLPPEQIIAIHEPWHAAFRYITSEGDRMLDEVAKGTYDSMMNDKSTRHYGRAIRTLKDLL
jgi:hypothetical protein